MDSPLLKLSFRLPASSADWAGQALFPYCPDGLLSHAPKGAPYALLSGWPRKHDPKTLESLKLTVLAIGGTQLRFTHTRRRDWVTEYKSRFPFQRLGRFAIVPEWRKRMKLAKGLHKILLLPGQAFGTGLHNSTRLMLKAVETVAPGKKLVLDIGAGSGILGFGCIAMGARKVVSIEIETAAAAEMKDNRKLNGIAPARFAVIAGSFPAALKGKKLKADLLLGNLVTPLLELLMPKLVGQVAKGGILLFSGIHTPEEAARVEAAARKQKLTLQARTTKGNWFCIRAQK